MIWHPLHLQELCEEYGLVNEAKFLATRPLATIPTSEFVSIEMKLQVAISKECKELTGRGLSEILHNR